MSAQQIPGPSGLPLLGHALKLLGDPLPFFEELQRDYGGINKLKLGPRTLILLHDPDLIRYMLVEAGDKYPKAEMGKEATKPLLGYSVATETDIAAWEEMRHYVLPLFNPRMLKSYFTEMADSLTQELTLAAELAADGAPFDMCDYMHQATFRVLIRTIFAEGIDKDEAAALVHLFDDITVFINARFITMNLPIASLVPGARKGKKALAELNRRVYRLIDERRAQGILTEDEQRDMLDVLLAATHSNGDPLTDEEIRDNCMTMLFGGHETTAGSVSWAWAYLAANPDKLAKMQAEIGDVLGHIAPTEMTLEHYKALRYTQQCFDEAMRLYPMFSFMPRQAGVDDVLGGYEIKKGTIVAFCAYTAQRDPKHWPNPTAFEPERHSPENKRTRHPASFLPFSQGARGCIGERMARMEATLLLAVLGRDFEFSLADGTLPAPKVAMSIKPSPLMMRAKKRGA